MSEIRRQRLVKLIAERFGGNQADFARATGRSPAIVWQHYSGHRAIGEKAARSIERALGLADYWLDGEKATASVSLGPAFYGRVPLISWVQAAGRLKSAGELPAGVSDFWISCAVPHSENTYALRVRGESMLNPIGRHSFSDGDIIYIDPERQPESGSFVIVRLPGESEAIFRQYLAEGSRRYLKASNPAWPNPIIELADDAEICGVVIGKFTEI